MAYKVLCNHSRPYSGRCAEMGCDNYVEKHRNRGTWAVNPAPELTPSTKLSENVRVIDAVEEELIELFRHYTDGYTAGDDIDWHELAMVVLRTVEEADP
jgi:hypothetical protein